MGSIRLAGATGIGGLGYATDKPELMAAGALLATGSSPRVYKSIISKGSTLSNIMKQPIIKGLVKQGATVAQEKNLKKDTINRISNLLGINERR